MTPCLTVGVMTPGYDGAMPNQERTPRRTIRVEDTLWRDSLAEARRRGLTLSDAIRDMLQRFVKREI